jgi:methylated-DNA-[protein]-cysteine S-methyltransferase
VAWYDIVASPLGPLFVGGSTEGIHRLEFMGEEPEDRYIARLALDTASVPERDPEAAHETATQLAAYFAGERTAFALPLAARGTEWQRRVWAALLEIPAGKTATYGQVAGALGRPSASRAVGAANGQNPIAIVVPCHRVVGANGTLTGYAGGLDRKRWLLEHELRSLPLFAATA